MPIIASIRRVIEGRMSQGVLEKISWEVDTLPWGGLPTPVSLYVWDVSQNYLNVTAVVAAGGPPTVLGNVLISQIISLLTIDHLYRVEYIFTIGGNTLSCFFELQCER